MKIVIKKLDDNTTEINIPREDMNEIGSEICEGIRMGLFGNCAADDASIDNTFQDMEIRLRGKLV